MAEWNLSDAEFDRQFTRGSEARGPGWAHIARPAEMAAT
jgi:hypothetical protein